MVFDENGALGCSKLGGGMLASLNTRENHENYKSWNDEALLIIKFYRWRATVRQSGGLIP